MSKTRKTRKSKFRHAKPPKSKNGIILNSLILFATLSIAIFSIGVFVVRQAEIEEKRLELQALIDETNEYEKLNSEYESILSESDERTYIERIAGEVLGYAYPNERRFYDSQG
jgi:cell division protein FtsB